MGWCDKPDAGQRLQRFTWIGGFTKQTNAVKRYASNVGRNEKWKKKTVKQLQCRGEAVTGQRYPLGEPKMAGRRAAAVALVKLPSPPALPRGSQGPRHASSRHRFTQSRPPVNVPQAAGLAANPAPYKSGRQAPQVKHAGTSSRLPAAPAMGAVRQELARRGRFP